MPCVSFNAWASDEEQVQIAKGILSFRCAITRKNARAIQEGTLQLAPAPLRVRGRLEWHKLFTPTTQLVATLVNIRKEAAQARTHNQNKQHVVNTLQLTCTQCSTARTASYHSLLGPKGWKRIWCSGQCHRSWASKKWQCACGMLWHMCVVHAHGNFSAPPTPTATRRAPRTRMQQALPCPMPAKRAKQNPCMLTFPVRTPPAASPDATDDKRGRKRKGSESAEQPPRSSRPLLNGPDSPHSAPDPAPPRARRDAYPHPPNAVGNQGQKRVAALLPAILAKSAKLAAKFGHLQ